LISFFEASSTSVKRDTISDRCNTRRHIVGERTLLVVGDERLGDGLADRVDLGGVTTTTHTDADVDLMCEGIGVSGGLFRVIASLLRQHDIYTAVNRACTQMGGLVRLLSQCVWVWGVCEVCVKM
jgi:hypothetical protein